MRRRIGCLILDGVELIMAAEEYFDIVIGDSEAEKIESVQDLVRVVQAKVCH